ncbi:GFA family protein [Sphingomonas sp. GCM10030256]|uniref:GFA family protein n=1 Tax=Sphingomonas sp. GCM10030256 TaxID=3273427 RepID=UPI003624389C
MPTGQCCCGACVIAVSGEPKLSAVCHCDDCRKRSGSAFGWSAYFPSEQVEGPRGDIGEYEPKVDAPQIRWFCRSCGTTLAWRTGRFPGLTGVAVGAFPSGSLAPPTIANKASACLEWVALPSSWRHIE